MWVAAKQGSTHSLCTGCTYKQTLGCNPILELGCHKSLVLAEAYKGCHDAGAVGVVCGEGHKQEKAECFSAGQLATFTSSTPLQMTTHFLRFSSQGVRGMPCLPGCLHGRLGQNCSGHTWSNMCGPFTPRVGERGEHAIWGGRWRCPWVTLTL